MNKINIALPIGFPKIFYLLEIVVFLSKNPSLQRQQFSLNSKGLTYRVKTDFN